MVGFDDSNPETKRLRQRLRRLIRYVNRHIIQLPNSYDLLQVYLSSNSDFIKNKFRRRRSIFGGTNIFKGIRFIVEDCGMLPQSTSEGTKTSEMADAMHFDRVVVRFIESYEDNNKPHRHKNVTNLVDYLDDDIAISAITFVVLLIIIVMIALFK